MLDLDEVKAHLRVDQNAEDGLILSLMATAAESVAQYLGKTPAELVPCPAPVKSAALMMVGDLFENREGQTDRQLHRNDTFERLLAPYRVYS